MSEAGKEIINPSGFDAFGILSALRFDCEHSTGFGRSPVIHGRTALAAPTTTPAATFTYRTAP